MNRDGRRISLIARGRIAPHRDWDETTRTTTRSVFVDSYAVLRYAVHTGVVDMHIDIERVVIDRAASPAEFLELLAALPHQFHGDAVLICHDDSGFVSAAARGGSRVLYQLSPHDVRFYLEANELVTERVALEERLTA